jgi:hypothetical protein
MNAVTKDRRDMNIKTLILAAGLTSAASLFCGPLHALPAAAGIELAPHRAIYDLRLRSAEASANVTDLTGRLVLDFHGSACSGYTYKSRLVTQMTDQDGGTFMTDMRTSTWEDGKGEEFRFENMEFSGVQQANVTSGSAKKDKGKKRISVNFEQPQDGSVEFDRRAMFPTQHSIAILEAAQDGKPHVQADVYDGSEEGRKLYSTTTFIGRPLRPGAGKDAVTGIDNAARLNALTSWPVSISFYDAAAPGKRDEGLPTYELAFRLFSNGVSGDLTINYGDFLIGGKLTRIDFTGASNCPNQ